MLIGFLVAFITAWMLGRFDVIFKDNSEPKGVLLAALIVFFTGFLDDIIDLAPPGKVTGVVMESRRTTVSFVPRIFSTTSSRRQPTTSTIGP